MAMYSFGQTILLMALHVFPWPEYFTYVYVFLWPVFGYVCIFLRPQCFTSGLSNLIIIRLYITLA